MNTIHEAGVKAPLHFKTRRYAPVVVPYVYTNFGLPRRQELVDLLVQGVDRALLDLRGPFLLTTPQNTKRIRRSHSIFTFMLSDR